ncbi:MAG: energy transducer TonB [Flavobacteriaceae bacterium]|nr:energy transducer TonB [Flavobacteriaceae bacterium]
MLPSIKNSDGAKTKVLSKREEKKRINIRWNSGLFFQIGLVVSLLLSIAAMEMKWDVKPVAVFTPDPDYTIEISDWKNYVIEKPKVEVVQKVEATPKPKIPKVTLASSFTAVKNTTKVLETKTGDSELKDAPVITKEPVAATTPKVVTPRSVNAVDMVPTFPGCEGIEDNKAKLACLSSKISAFVGRKFDTEKYSGKYAGQTLRINVQFTIDANGNVTDVLARSQGEDLEGEATKVMSKLPQMTPAQYLDESVPVIYRMPIIFRAEY